MIKWGILGCGAVTEMKSGPALQKAKRSSVVACMRRDGDKAKDYAKRHGIDRAYANADELINDDAVNAVYIATPPSSHAELAIKAMRAGKPVLVEKPMALSVRECDAMCAASEETGQSLIIAYYRRALPRFEKMREIIESGMIGEPRCALVQQHMRDDGGPTEHWKKDPSISGGGLFTDMQTHALDWLHYTFGPTTRVEGLIRNPSAGQHTEELVSYTIGFEKIVATGLCCYSAGQDTETVTIHGSQGSVAMSFFSQSRITLTQHGLRSVHDIRDPQHVHQPFVERVIAHLIDGKKNPCPPDAARHTTAILEQIYASSCASTR